MVTKLTKLVVIVIIGVVSVIILITLAVLINMRAFFNFGIFPSWMILFACLIGHHPAKESRYTNPFKLAIYQN